MMVGRWVSFWDGLFLGVMLNFRGVPLFLETSRLPKNGKRCFSMSFLLWLHQLRPFTACKPMWLTMSSHPNGFHYSRHEFPSGANPEVCMGCFWMRCFFHEILRGWASKNGNRISNGRKETCVYMVILMFKLSKKINFVFFWVVFGDSFQSWLQIFWQTQKRRCHFTSYGLRGPKTVEKTKGCVCTHALLNSVATHGM